MNLLTMVHLKKHENGFYYIIYNRKRRRSLGTKDKALAERLFRRARREYLEGKIIGLDGGAGKTLSEFWEEYEEYRFKTASKFSQQTDRQAFRIFRQALGDDTKLGRLSRKKIEQALADQGRRVSPVSANTWFRHFKAALGKAVEWDYLKKNPCQGIKLLRTQEDYPRFLSEEEFDLLLAAETLPRFRLFWKWCVYGGARRSENLSIEVKDINRPLHRIDLGHTKNGKPKFIVLTSKLEEILAEIGQDVGRLWPWRPDTVSHHFKATARAAGLDCRLHDLRHTYGSWLIMKGVPLRTVQLLMGHQDIKTTERYAHVSAAHLEEAAGRL